MDSSELQTSRRRTAQGERTRQAILRIAVDIASIEGLDGISIGRLAAELGMSKSGLFAHFGSKEDLQLATIEAASEIFADEVIQPALTYPAGMKRLCALCRLWFSYAQYKVFQGGCFFAAATTEFDSRPGKIRNHLAQSIKKWLSILANTIHEAQNLGELDSTIEPTQLAFEIHALFWGANWMFQLYNNPQVVTQAKVAVLQRLQSASTSTFKLEF